jgi:hypothetical protein
MPAFLTIPYCLDGGSDGRRSHTDFVILLIDAAIAVADEKSSTKFQSGNKTLTTM